MTTTTTTAASPGQIVIWFLRKRNEVACRLRRDVSVADLEELCGVSRTPVLGWLYRGLAPAEADLPRVAATLGNDIYALLGITPPEPSLHRCVGCHLALGPDECAQVVTAAERPQATDAAAA
jgi:hypothetical protein